MSLSAVAREDSDRLLPLPGRWACDLSDGSLRWSREVYELFGVPAEARLVRRNIVRLYVGESRDAMEALRHHAIERQASFTMDARIMRLDGSARWMRLSADIIWRNGRVSHLIGHKLDVTDELALRRPFVPDYSAAAATKSMSRRSGPKAVQATSTTAVTPATIASASP